MHRFSSSWSNTLRKLGFKIASTNSKRTKRRYTIEPLERRLVFSTSHLVTPFLPGDCPDDTPCECGNVSPSKDGNATTSNKVGGVSMSYNGGTQPHPILMFNLSILPQSSLSTSEPENAYVKVESEGTIEFDTTYFDAPDTGGRKTFAFQADAGSLTSGRYFWVGEVSYHDSSGQLSNPEAHFFAFQDVINRDYSEFGAGWQITELDRLVTDQYLHNDLYYINESGVSLITGDNRAVWFGVHSTDGDLTYYSREAGNPHSFADLKYDDSMGRYTLTNPDQSKSIFNSAGLLITREDRLGNHLRSYNYNLDDTLNSITDISGRVTQFSYDGYGHATSITDFYETSGAQTTHLEYDNDAALGGRLIKITEPDPDGAGPLTSPVTSYTYYTSGDAVNLLKSITDPRGLATNIEYDSMRRISLITERCGGTIEIESIPSNYADAIGATGTSPTNLAQLISTSSTNDYEIVAVERRVVFGNEEIITRNTSSQITSRTDAAGNVTQYEYYYAGKEINDYPHGFGLLYRVIEPDPDGDGPLPAPETVYEYDNFYFLQNSDIRTGLLTDIYHPIGTEHWGYDGEFGQVIQYTDPESNVTTYDINGTSGNVEGMTRQLGSGDLVTAYSYTDGTIKGLIETITDPNGNVTRYTYNAQGLVETIIYAEVTGDEVEETYEETYEYDDRDRLWKFTDGRGYVTEFLYDNLDRLIKRIDPDPDGPGDPLASPEWEYRYDRAGNQTHVIDPLDSVTEYIYDVRGRVMQMIRPLPSGAPGVITKDDNQSSATTGTWLGPLTVSLPAYDDTIKISTSDGASATYTFTDLSPAKKYAVQVRWITAIDPNALDKNALWEVFAGNGTTGPLLNKLNVNLNSQPEGLPDGSSLMWLSLGAFSPASGALTIKLSDDDTNGKLVIDAVRLVEVGPVTQTEYDCNGNLVRAIDPLNRVTEFQYDELNRLTTRTDPDPDGAGSTFQSPATHYTYNALGWLTSVMGPNENVTFYHYDAMGRPLKEVQVVGSGLTGEFFDGSTLLQRTNDPDIDYEPFTSLPNGFTAVWTGGIHFEQSAEVMFYLNNTDHSQLYIDDVLILDNQSSSGNELGSDSAFITSGWHTIKVTFNDIHVEAESSLALLFGTEGGEVTLRGTQVTTSSYDAAGRLETITDPNGNTTTYGYDSVNRLTSESIGSEPLTRSYEYDLNSNLIRKTDRNGRLTEYEYDHLDRLKSEVWYDGETPIHTISYTYDDNSNLLSVTDPSATYQYTYDNLDRTKTILQVIDGLDPYVLFYRQYDDASRTTVAAGVIGGSTDYWNGYTYDRLGRQTRVLQQMWYDNAVNVKRVDFTYNVASELTGITRFASINTSLPVAQSIFEYDQAGRLYVLAHESTASGSSFYEEHFYTHDLAGRITSYSNYFGSFSVDYDYDATNQLILEDRPGPSNDVSYQYDSNGNRLSTGGSTFVVGPYNRLLSDGAYTYQYDDEGNITRRTDISTGAYTVYGWDHRNRLISVTEHDAEEVAFHGVNYSYDAFNQLVSRAEWYDDGSNEKSVLIHDGGQIVFEFHEESLGSTPVGELEDEDLARRFLWGPAVDQLLAEEHVEDLFTGTGNETLWALTDHLGSVRDVVDSAGTLRLHRGFDAFGNIIDETYYDAEGEELAPGWFGYETLKFAYTGRPTDETTGLQNNLNRWYNPETGRWMSEDPIGFAAGDANLFRYVGNMPTTYIDPRGFSADVEYGYGAGSFGELYPDPFPPKYPTIDELLPPTPMPGLLEPPSANRNNPWWPTKPGEPPGGQGLGNFPKFLKECFPVDAPRPKPGHRWELQPPDFKPDLDPDKWYDPFNDPKWEFGTRWTWTA